MAEQGGSGGTIAQMLPLLDVEPALQARAGSRMRRLSATIDTRRCLRATSVVHPHAESPLRACGLIMAGGFGRRLGEMTRTVPKPMLQVAGKPIAEHLVDNLVDNGITDLFMSVYYLADVVRSHFRDGADWGARIRYVQETTPLGTAGCLSLMAGELDRPLVVVNGDVITNLQFSRLLDHHARTGSQVTMAVRRHHVTLPYGVVDHSAGGVVGIREKPRLSYDINTAIYVLSPEVVRQVHPGVKTDMPDLIQSVLPMGFKVTTFNLMENWIDVGSVTDFARASETYDPLHRPRLAARPGEERHLAQMAASAAPRMAQAAMAGH